MNGRNDKETKTYRKNLRNPPLSVKLIQNTKPDPTYFFRSTLKNVSTMVMDCYQAIIEAWSLDQFNFDIKKIIAPIAYSVVDHLVVNAITKKISLSLTGSEEYDFAFKFLIGATILANSARYRITDTRIKSSSKYYRAAASEMVGIAYLYSSTFCGTRLFFNNRSPDFSLIMGLGASTILVPGALSRAVKKFQDYSIKKTYEQGAQRSNTAIISSGRTNIANTFFMLNEFLWPEISALPRLFQLGLISNNILNNPYKLAFFNKILKQFKNAPAFCVDVIPPTIRKIVAQRQKIETDYQFNNTRQTVVRFTNGPLFMDVPRYQLKRNDLVLCDNRFNVESSPLSGEIFALERDSKGVLTSRFAESKYHINLERKNGENVWLPIVTKKSLSDEFKRVELNAVRSRTQAGVLVGTKINFNLHDNKEPMQYAVRIMEEKERLSSNSYEKKPIINSIIAKHERRCVMFTMVASLATAGILSRDLEKLPVCLLNLLFNLYQVYISFSGSILRDMVNGRLLKEINNRLQDNPMEILSVLRAVDLCNMLAGYYEDKFNSEIVLLSDKTGTITKPIMVVQGLWTEGMHPNVQKLLTEEKKSSELLPDREKQLACSEVYFSAYPNSNPEIEPEEARILWLCKKILNNQDDLKIESLGNNYFQKTFVINGAKKSIITLHMSDLFRSLGGRCSLVEDGKNKYLVYCGIPTEQFKDTPLLKSYETMQVRTEVLSRDWCIARTVITDDKIFQSLKELFLAEKRVEAEKLICTNPKILQSFIHYGTFIIDNPVKEYVTQFVSNCSDINTSFIPVTGDNEKAAKNIAKVLFPAHINNIVTVRANSAKEIKGGYTKDTTVIFVGINDDLLMHFNELMKVNLADRPRIIFSEMSAAGKGALALHIKKQNYFVIANGDGSNDLSMMANANFVIAHVAENGSYAPGIKEYADISDAQLKKLFRSDRSFYELFDIHRRVSQFTQLFARFANTQEMPSITSLLKSAKMTTELAVAVGATQATEMPYQHWIGVGFDIAWLTSSFNLIYHFADFTMDKKHLGRSSLPLQCTVTATSIAILSAAFNYFVYNEQTNPATLLLLYTLFLVGFPAICSRFGEAQNQLPPIEEEKYEKPPSPSKSGLFGRCGKRRRDLLIEDANIVKFKKN